VRVGDVDDGSLLARDEEGGERRKTAHFQLRVECPEGVHRPGVVPACFHEEVHVLSAPRLPGPPGDAVGARQDEGDSPFGQGAQDRVQIDRRGRHSVTPLEAGLPLQEEDLLDAFVVTEVAPGGLCRFPCRVTGRHVRPQEPSLGCHAGGLSLLIGRCRK
jgi:hypothetical protein